MGRLPNHRFSVARDCEITPLEAKLDSFKRNISRPFTRAQGQELLTRRLSVSSPHILCKQKKTLSNVICGNLGAAIQHGEKQKERGR